MQHWSFEDYDDVRKHTVNNLGEVLNSTIVGCYACKRHYIVTDSVGPMEHNGTTSMCRFCGEKTVVGDKTGYPVTNQRFLQHMHWYAFEIIKLNNGCVTARHPNCIQCWQVFNEITSPFIFPDTTYQVTNLTCTCSDFPFQLEGSTSCGKDVYVRDRWGVLRIEIDGIVMFKIRHDIDTDERELGSGEINYSILRSLTKKWFTWPEWSDVQ